MPGSPTQWLAVPSEYRWCAFHTIDSPVLGLRPMNPNSANSPGLMSVVQTIDVTRSPVRFSVCVQPVEAWGLIVIPSGISSSTSTVATFPSVGTRTV